MKGRNNVIADLTRPNSLYLSAAARNAHEQILEVFDRIHAIDAAHDVVVSVAEAARLAEGDLDRRIIDFLGKIGTGVVNYRRNETEFSENL